jgi:hypothetical protein
MKFCHSILQNIFIEDDNICKKEPFELSVTSLLYICIDIPDYGLSMGRNMCYTMHI